MQEKKAPQRPEHHDYCPHASSFSLLTRILFSSKHTRSPGKIQAVQGVELFRLSALYPRDEQGIPGASCLLSLADHRHPSEATNWRRQRSPAQPERACQHGKGARAFSQNLAWLSPTHTLLLREPGLRSPSTEWTAMPGRANRRRMCTTGRSAGSLKGGPVGCVCTRYGSRTNSRAPRASARFDPDWFASCLTHCGL